MSWAISLQLHRQTPLNSAERAALRAALRAVRAWPWESGGLRLELPAKPLANGLLGRALIQVPYDPESDAARVREAAAAFEAAIDGLRALVDDGVAEDVALLDEGEGEWVDALPPPPTTLPEKLARAIRALEAGPDEPALKLLRTDANVGKLLERLADKAAPEAEIDAVRDALRHIDPDTLYAAALKRFKKLDAYGQIALREAAERLSDLSAAAAAFLAVWKKGSGRYHWKDFVGLTPDAVLARIARDPAVHDQLVQDLAEARSNTTEVTECARGAAAAQLLGRARTVESLAALLPELVRLRTTPARWEYGEFMPRGLSAGLGWTVLSPIGAGPGFRPPVPTLRLRLAELSSNIGDSHRELLTAFAVADPARAWPLLLCLLDNGLWVEPALAALTAMPGDAPLQLLRWLAAGPRERVADKAVAALVEREGAAAMPTWLAIQDQRGGDYRAPHTLYRHGFGWSKLLNTREAWVAWLAERGLDPAAVPELPAEERLMLWEPLRPGYPAREAWRASLQAAHAAADPTLARALLLGAELYRRRERQAAIDLARPTGLGLEALAGLPLAEQLAALQARADLPPQREPMLARAFAGRPIDALIGAATTCGFPDADKAEWEAEERAWWRDVLGVPFPGR